MQDISATSLAASRAAGRPAVVGCYVMWDGVNWYDESERVMNASGSREAVNSDAGIAACGGGMTESATITLWNADGRFSPWKTDGPLYAYIRDGKWKGLAVRVKRGYKTATDVIETVYTLKGHLDDLAPALSAGVVTLTCLDKASRLLEYKARSTLFEGLRTDQIVEALTELIPASYRPTVAAGTLVMDRGSFTIPYAWVDDEGLWDELSKIAEAEGGRIYYTSGGGADVSGGLVFEGATHLLSGAHTTSVATFAVNDWTELSGAASWKDYKNHVEVHYLSYHVEHRQELWKATERHRVPAGGSISVRAQFNTPAYSIVDPVAAKDYIGVSAGGKLKTDSLTVAITKYAQQALLTIANAAAIDVSLVRLKLRGYPIVADDSQKVSLLLDDNGAIVSDPVSTAVKAGWRTLTIKDNPYIQSREHADALARFLLDRYKAARMAVQLSNLDDMPWLEIGDRVTVTEAAGASVGAFFVQRLDWRYNPNPGSGGMSMDVSLLPADSLFAYSDYFVLGVNTLGSASASPGRYFY